MVKDRVIWGFSLAFVEKEKAALSYHGVMGSTSPYDSLPVKKGLFYDLASLSKVIGTTSRILQLVEAHELSLDTPVAQLLPRFSWNAITVGHLLLHCSGLPAEIPDKYQLTRENILDRLYRTAPEFKPEEQFVYSDVGYILLGLIIQEGIGLKNPESLGKSFQHHVFAPLNMNHTSFPVPAQIICCCYCCCSCSSSDCCLSCCLCCSENSERSENSVNCYLSCSARNCCLFQP